MNVGRGRNAVLPEWYVRQLEREGKPAVYDTHNPSLQSINFRPKSPERQYNANDKYTKSSSYINKPTEYNNQPYASYSSFDNKPKSYSTNAPISDNTTRRPNETNSFVSIIDQWRKYRCTPYEPRPKYEREVANLFDSKFIFDDFHRDRQLNLRDAVERLYLRGPDSVKIVYRLTIDCTVDLKFVIDCEIHEYEKGNSDYYIFLHQIKNKCIKNSWCYSDKDKIALDKRIHMKEFINYQPVQKLLYIAEDYGYEPRDDKMDFIIM